MYHTILVPLDGSERAEAILPHVEDMAGRYGATVVFLCVVEPVPLTIGFETPYAFGHKLSKSVICQIGSKPCPAT